MPESDANSSSADYRGNPETAAIRRRLRIIAVVIAAILFGLTTIALLLESPASMAPADDATTADSEADIHMAASGIDPNTASWAELALLPGLGESVARRIVELRERRESQGIHPAFSRPEDLLLVKGIGAKTLQRMRHLLRMTEQAPPD